MSRAQEPAAASDLFRAAQGQTLLRAQGFSCLEFSPYPAVLRELTRRNWFREPDEARIVAGHPPA